MKLPISVFLYLGVLAASLSACKKKKDVLPEGEILLPRATTITDAEYSKKKDILVYVSTNPSQLNVFYTSQNKTDVIPLAFIPLSVSISMDANSVVVGHDAHLTHIDLNKKAVINTYDVTCEAFDIVLGNNNWAYVFPKRDQWQNIHCINLSNGNESLSTGSSMYAGSKAKLHPSGKFIYVTNNGLSPSDIDKYDIQGGKATWLYDSPYHGDYPIAGDLWFSEDGKRVFVKGQTTLRLSEEKNIDMTYNGTVGLDTIKNSYDQNKKIFSLDHSALSNKLYAISTDTLYWSGRPNMPYVWIYDASNLSYQKKISVKKFAGNPLTVIEPYFVFVNSKGDQIYVITKETESTTSEKWAIQVL